MNLFPLSFTTQPPRPERYWPDSWEMKCWRPCCDPIMRSRNCFARFLAMFFVAPLTNVTGLSLYYQLYLTEIFHLRFATKFGHYIFMVGLKWELSQDKLSHHLSVRNGCIVEPCYFKLSGKMKIVLNPVGLLEVYMTGGGGGGPTYFLGVEIYTLGIFWGQEICHEFF